MSKNTNVCETPGCGTWTEYPQVRHCVDCKRKHKKLGVMPCAVKHCQTLLPKRTHPRLCEPHRAQAEAEDALH